jgi:RHS repeat-associated protein
VLNLRFPGQYYDAESETNYNMVRNYEPVTGRYQQSDPIGLAGASARMATWGDPLTYTDSKGKLFGVDDVAEYVLGAAIVGAVAAGFTTYMETGGDWTATGEAAAGGFVGGAVAGVLAAGEAATAIGVAAGLIADTAINAATDAWSASQVTGPLPARQQPSCQ